MLTEAKAFKDRKERELKKLEEVLTDLGTSTTSNPTKYQRILFDASLIRNDIETISLVISHIDVCVDYIRSLETTIHKLRTKDEKIENDIAPLVRAKRWYSDTKTIAAFIASTIGLIAAWQGYLAYLSKVGGGE